MNKITVEPYKGYFEAFHKYMKEIRNEILTELLEQQTKDNQLGSGSSFRG